MHLKPTKLYDTYIHTYIHTTLPHHQHIATRLFNVDALFQLEIIFQFRRNPEFCIILNTICLLIEIMACYVNIQKSSKFRTKIEFKVNSFCYFTH